MKTGSGDFVKSGGKKPAALKKRKTPAAISTGQCLCGAVKIEINVPAFWAWHDHSRASRLAHGAAYATYVGCWRSRVRVMKGADRITRFEDNATKPHAAFARDAARRFSMNGHTRRKW